MKIVFALCAVLLLIPSHAFTQQSTAATINISTQTEVPGTSLKPGKYSIRIVGKLTDRVIIKVKDDDGGTNVDFLGLPNATLRSSPGLTTWSAPVNGTTFLRGWVPPGSSSMIEFVYPKDEAVSIATVNDSKVPAIDPASQGIKVDPTLSKEDMKLVTLWLLSSTRVAPSDSKPAIKAERYQTASFVQPRPTIASLPHTASSLPSILLGSLFAIALAAYLRWRRLFSTAPNTSGQV